MPNNDMFEELRRKAYEEQKRQFIKKDKESLYATKSTASGRTVSVRRTKLKEFNEKQTEIRRQKALEISESLYTGHSEEIKLPPRALQNDSYDYTMQHSNNPNKSADVTPAHQELEFMKDLFPYQNVKAWEGKSGREFLADFTKMTRAQLVICMSRLAQENNKEFCRIWIEMEKFNTPQQSSQTIDANITQTVDLYAELEAQSRVSEVGNEIPAEELDAYNQDYIESSEDNQEEYKDEYPEEQQDNYSENYNLPHSPSAPLDPLD